MFSCDVMDNSSSSIGDEPQLITETLSFDENDFSVLPVIVDGQTVSLSDFETDPLESETLLSIPFNSISPASLLLPAKDVQDPVSEECKGNVFEMEEVDTDVTEETKASESEESYTTVPQVINIPLVVSEVEPQCNLVEGQILQLEGGTIAYIHSQPQDGSQAVELENGAVAYITLTQPISLVETKELKVVEHIKKQRSFMCPQEGCGRLYTSSHHLKVHERTHTGSRPYMCTEEGCTKAFSTDYSRKAHIRTHTGEKPYKCPESPNCSKSFKTSGDLQKHIRTHTGERPFVCPVDGCNRSFTTSNIRKVHIRTHTGERPYVCSEPMCDKAFASATNYKNHIRIHSGEKPYCCNVEGCNKKFTEYSSLYKHHMVHTQEKPYLCNVCGRSYRQVSTLTVHKRTSHGVIETEDGTEIVLGKVFTQKVLKSANILAQSSNIKTIKSVTTSLLNDGEYVLDKEGSIQRISSEQIFIIEDMPEHLTALQSIEDTDEEELHTSLDPLQEQ